MKEFEEKKYIKKANNQLPKGWKLLEQTALTSAGRPTFFLTLRWVGDWSYGTVHQWVVLAQQPRHELRRVVKAVEEGGLLALLKIEETYVSRIAIEGYGHQTVGLREALKTLMLKDVDELIDSKKEVEDVASETELAFDIEEDLDEAALLKRRKVYKIRRSVATS